MPRLIIVAMLAVLHCYTANCQKFVVKPVNITAAINQKVELRCVFDEPVNCAWQRNGYDFFLPDEKNGYAYIRKTDPFAEDTDCSIRIAAISEADFGKWGCASLVTGSKPFVAGPEISISITNKSIDEYNYDLKKYIVIPIGVTVACITIIVGIYHYKRKSAKKRLLRIPIPASFKNKEVTDNTDSGCSMTSTDEPEYFNPIPNTKQNCVHNINETEYENTTSEKQNEHTYLQLI